MTISNWTPEVLEYVASRITELGGDDILRQSMIDVINRELIEKYGFIIGVGVTKTYIYTFNLKKNKKVKEYVGVATREMIRKNYKLPNVKLVQMVNKIEPHIVPMNVVTKIKENERCEVEGKKDKSSKKNNKWKFEYGHSIFKKIALEETAQLRQFHLEQGKKYLIEECTENKNKPKFHCVGVREFIYMTEFNLFFKHPKGWLESYQRHNGLVRVIEKGA